MVLINEQMETKMERKYFHFFAMLEMGVCCMLQLWNHMARSVLLYVVLVAVNVCPNLGLPKISHAKPWLSFSYIFKVWKSSFWLALPAVIILLQKARVPRWPRSIYGVVLSRLGVGPQAAQGLALLPPPPSSWWRKSSRTASDLLTSNSAQECPLRNTTQLSILPKQRVCFFVYHFA